MKKIINGMMLILAGVLPAFAGNLTVDNLTVISNGTFYGNVEIKSVSPSSPTSGMKLFYDFVTNATPVADQSGNSNTGTITSATWVSSGQTNGAYEFDGSNDRIVSASNPLPGLNCTSSFSVAMWLYKNSSCGTDKMPWIINGVGTGNFGIGFYVNCSLGYSLTLSVLKQNVAWTSIGSNALTNNIWQFVVGTYDNRAMNLYVDGVSVASGTFAYSDTTATTQPLDLGSQAGANFFKGKIDEVRVYNRVLSSAEISGLYYYYTTNRATNVVMLSVDNISSSNSISQSSSTATNVFMGRVGIGTNSPSTNVMMHVVGNAQVDGKITVSTSPVSSTDVGNLGYNDSRYARLAVDTNTFTGNARFGQGISFIINLSDVGMGVYTNGP